LDPNNINLRKIKTLQRETEKTQSKETTFELLPHGSKLGFERIGGIKRSRARRPIKQNREL